MKSTASLSVPLILLLFLLGGESAVYARSRGDSLLIEIDKTLKHRDVFARERAAKIDTLMGALGSADNEADRYNIYRGLFSSYRHYRTDSAVYVAGERLASARRLNDASKINSASLNMAEGLSALGNYHDALMILDTLDRSSFESYHYVYIYQLYERTYDNLAQEDALPANIARYRLKAKQARDSLMGRLNPGDLEYRYAAIRQLIADGMWQQAIDRIDNERALPLELQTRLLIDKAEAHHHLGEGENEKEALARAVLISLQSGTKDYSALLDLARHLNSEGDHERAYNYIHAAMEDASFANTRPSTTRILQAIPVIEAARQEEQNDKILLMRVLCGVTLALLVAVLLLLWHRQRQLDKIKLLKRTLEQANALKDTYINDIFGQYSGFIKRIQNYRKNISRLLTVGKTREAMDVVNSDKIEVEELREMYDRFDKVFLSLNPNFLAEYNSMVVDSARVAPDATSLTSALRVLALIKIGVTTTAQIASMLHYTPQTVYNYRNKIKGSLAVDEGVFERWSTATHEDNQTKLK